MLLPILSETIQVGVFFFGLKPLFELFRSNFGAFDERHDVAIRSSIDPCVVEKAKFLSTDVKFYNFVIFKRRDSSLL